MANDIIDINVSETVDSVSITVNPNLTTVNINQVTGGLNQTLQSVTTLGSTTTNSITAASFVKTGGTASQLLAANGTSITAGTNITISGGTISSAGGGATNLTTSQTVNNFTINSDTGTDASVPLGDGTLAGASLNDYTTAEKNKLGAISGTNTGDQTNITGNAGTVTTNANLTGVVTSLGNATAIANGVITNAMLSNGAVANLSGTNTGDQNLSGFQLTSAKDAISGYAGLDGGGKINPLQLPALAITDTFVVATQAAMLALTAEVGDVAVRTDLNKSFILRLTGASTLANWQELLTPTDAVSSVFGRSGTVSAQNNDYTTDQILETATKVFLTPAEKTAIAHTNRASLDLVSGTNTGDNATNSQYSGLAASKQDVLGFTPENIVNKDNGTISTSVTTYPTSGAVKTALNTKQDVLGFTPVKFIINSFPNTNSLANTLDQSLGSFLIPANTLPVSSLIKVQARIQKSGTSSATLRIKVNSTNNFATATTIGLLTLSAATQAAIMTRNPLISSVNLLFGSATASIVTDEIAVSTVENATFFDVTQDNYFFVSVQLVNASDLVQLKNLRITN